MKLITKSKCYNPTTEENLCPRSLMHFLWNVEFNDKQVCPIPHNKMVLQIVPIKRVRNMILAQGLEHDFGTKQ
jgi:hypothetical protein